VLAFVDENLGKRPFAPVLAFVVRIGENGSLSCACFVNERLGKRPFVPFFLLWVRDWGKRQIPLGTNFFASKSGF